MQRVLEPELMDDEIQARAYAQADFAEPHSAYPKFFSSEFKSLPSLAVALDLGEVILGVAFTVIVASEVEFSFGPGLAALVPQRFTGPRVATDGAAAL